MNWRKLTKLGATDTPLTLEMFQKGEIKKGDYVACVGDLPSLTTGEIAFKANKYYEVLDVKGNGIAVASEDQPRYIHLDSEDGGAQWFYLAALSDDEKLGIFEGIPEEILRLLNEHKTASRRSIISELQLKYYSRDEKDQNKTKDAVFQSLMLLQKLEYIESGRAIGYYKITDRGRIFLRGGNFAETHL